MRVNFDSKNSAANVCSSQKKNLLKFEFSSIYATQSKIILHTIRYYINKIQLLWSHVICPTMSFSHCSLCNDIYRNNR